MEMMRLMWISSYRLARVLLLGGMAAEAAVSSCPARENGKTRERPRSGSEGHLMHTTEVSNQNWCSETLDAVMICFFNHIEQTNQLLIVPGVLRQF